MPNPLIAAGAYGAGALGDYAAGAQGRKQSRWGFGQRKDLYDMLRWKTYGKQGDVIDPAKMTQLMSLFKQGMQPQMDKMTWQAGRHTGLSSPESQRMMMGQIMPLLAQFQGGLMQQNIGMTQERDMNLLRLMSQLAGGQ